MRKLFALYRNEMSKILRRVSIFIGLIVMFVALGSCALINRERENYGGYDYHDYYQSQLQYGQDTLKDREADLKLLRTEIEKTREAAGVNAPGFDFETYYRDYPDDAWKLINNCYSYLDTYMYKRGAELRIVIYQFAANDTKLSSGALRANVTQLEELSDADFYMPVQQKLYGLMEDPDKSGIADYETAAAEIDALYETVDAELSNRITASDGNTVRDIVLNFKNTHAGTGTDTERVYGEACDMVLAYADRVDIECAQYLLEKISTYVNQRTTLEHDDKVLGSPNPNLDELWLKCTESEREESRKALLILEYSLKHGTLADDAGREYDDRGDSRETLKALSTVGTFVTAAFLIMLAGGLISSEMNNGSVKSLIIAPVRRGKIFTAKLASLITVELIFIAANFVLTLAFSAIFTGLRHLGSVVFTVGGTAVGINYVAALLLTLLIDGIAVFFFAVLALMLSSLTHNTGVSVTFPLLGFLGGYLIDALIALNNGGLPFVKAILPMRNVSNLLFAKELPSIFKLFDLDALTRNVVSPWFSVIYLGLLLAAMLLCARDAFCRRDIT